MELGCTHSTEHTIKVTDDTPFKEWFRQIPPPLVEVQSHLREMLESGAIWPSQSAWCNAVVLVRKKDGGLQFCIDFCCLNTHMKKDSYPLLRIQEVLESLVGAGHVLYLDLKSGFWQIQMKEASKQYTLFTVGNLGFFECNHMPLGLCNAPAMFQRLMQNCLCKLNLIYCLIYLDNIIVFLQTVEEHLHWLYVVFDWFREYNLKLKWSKFSLFKEEINYLCTESPRKVCSLAVWIWEPSLNVHHPKPTWNSSLSWPFGPLLVVYKGICMYCIATEWTPSQEKGSVGNQKRCRYWKTPWESSMLWNRCAWVPQY